jgi:GST-like protein
MADAPQTKPSLPEGYEPPAVWTWEKPSGGTFASINRPIAGPTHDKVLPVGDHALQLYSLGTPNGQKASIMLEELLQAGKPADYDAWYIDIGEGDQFGSGFVEVNPNSKIPVLLDRSDPAKPQRVFESGSILLYLAEKYDAFLPKDPAKRTEALNWLFWQMGSAPFVGGGFGHFFAYAPVRIEYAIDRYAMEAKRQYDVLDRHLAEHRYMAGNDYSIADIAIWPWYGAIALGQGYPGASEFLALRDYKNVMRWTEEVGARPGVQRGRRVNRKVENDPTFIRERHSAADLD